MDARAIMAPDRRAFLTALGGAALLAACGEGGVSGEASALHDLRGRPVRGLPSGGRLSIDDGRFLIALSLIHPDPVSLLAAWSGDVNRISPEMYAAFVERFPAMADLPRTAQSGRTFDLEAVLAAQPSVAVVSLDSGP